MARRNHHFASYLPSGILFALIIGLTSIGQGQEINTRAAKVPSAATPAAAKAYTSAADLQNQKDFEGAVKQWKRFLMNHRSDPLAVDAKHYMGVCLTQIGEFEKAIPFFTDVIKAKSGFDDIEETYMNLGWSHYVAGSTTDDSNHMELAAKAFGKQLKRFPDGNAADQALFFRGEALYRLGKVKESLKSYETLVNDFRKSPLRGEALFAMGTSYDELNQLEPAKEAYEKFLRLYNDHVLADTVSMNLGQVHMTLQEFGHAEDLFEDLVRKSDFKGRDQAMFQQAYCLAKQEKYSDAGDVYLTFRKKFPTHELYQQATLEAGRCLYRSKRDDVAMKTLLEVLKSDEEASVEAAHWIARTLMRQGRGKLAIQSAQRALDWADENTTRSDAFVAALKMDIAEVLVDEASDFESAINACLRVTNDHPKSTSAPIALYKASAVAKVAKRYTQAGEFAQRFIEEYSDHQLIDKVQALKAESALLRGDSAAAEKAYQEIIVSEDGGRAVQAKLQLGHSLFLQERFEEAALELNGIASKLTNPSDRSRSLYLLGVCKLRQKQIEPAIEALSNSLLQEPKGEHAPQVCQRLAEALFAAGRVEDSKYTLEKMLVAFPKHQLTESTLFQLAELKLGTRDEDGARRRYQELLEKYPHSRFAADTRIRLAELAARHEDHRRVEREITKLFERPDLHEDVLAKGSLLRANARRILNDNHGCLEDSVNFLSYAPDSDQRWDAMLMKAQCQRELDQLSEAQTTLTDINQKNPSYARRDQVVYQLAWISLMKKQTKGALGHFATIVKTFPRSRHVPEAHFHLGQGDYRGKEFRSAAGHFNASAKLAEGTIREKSLYKLGWCAINLKEYQSALDTFTQLGEEFPDGELTSDATFMSAESLFRMGRYNDALPVYLSLIENRGLSKQARELVHLHGGQAANSVDKGKIALGWLEPMDKLFPQSPYLTRAKLEVARAESTLGRLLDSEYHYMALAREQNDMIGATARFELARLFQKQDQLGRAVREFQTLMYGYGGKSAPAAIKSLQAKAAIAAAECATQMADQPGRGSRGRNLAQAQKMYRYVITSHGDSKWAPEANRQLKRMANAETESTLR